MNYLGFELKSPGFGASVLKYYFFLDMSSGFKTILCSLFPNYLVIFLKISKYSIKITCFSLLNVTADKIYLIHFSYTSAVFYSLLSLSPEKSEIKSEI